MKVSVLSIITTIAFLVASSVYATATQDFVYETDRFLLQISVNGGYDTRPDIELINEVNPVFSYILGLDISMEKSDKYYWIFLYKVVGKSWSVHITFENETVFQESNIDTSLPFIFQNLLPKVLGTDIKPVMLFDGYSLKIIERFEKDALEEVERFWSDKYLFLWDDYTIKLCGDLSQYLFWTDEVEQGRYRIRFGMFVSYEEVQRIKNELSPMENELRIIPLKFESDRFGELF